MVAIPSRKNTTENRIENKKFPTRKPRPYLGMSGIGNECLRAQWYSWRWVQVFSVNARMNRIFTYGHNEESLIIKDLKEVGIEIFRIQGENKIEMTGEVGEEQEEIVGAYGHAAGHPDGRLTGVIEAPKTEHLLEMKTMNEKNFSWLKDCINKHGPEKGLQCAKPGYYAQMTRYKGGLNLTRGLFVATNKNDSARAYIRTHLDKKLLSILIEREEQIIGSEKPPKKRFKPDHFLCAWCNYHQICHLGKKADKNCRTCMHCDVMPKGKWHCSLKDKRLVYARQLKGCKKYRALF